MTGAAQLPAWTPGSCLLEYVPATVEALQAQVCSTHSDTHGLRRKCHPDSLALTTCILSALP